MVLQTNKKESRVIAYNRPKQLEAKAETLLTCDTSKSSF